MKDWRTKYPLVAIFLDAACQQNSCGDFPVEPEATAKKMQQAEDGLMELCGGTSKLEELHARVRFLGATADDGYSMSLHGTQLAAYDILDSHY